MKEYLIRMSCEYSLVIQAETEEDAREQANDVDMDKMDQAWSPIEIESTEVQP